MVTPIGINTPYFVRSYRDAVSEYLIEMFSGIEVNRYAICACKYGFSMSCVSPGASKGRFTYLNG
jgi:hypothetical protein